MARKHEKVFTYERVRNLYENLQGCVHVLGYILEILTRSARKQETGIQGIRLNQKETFEETLQENVKLVGIASSTRS